MKKIKLVALLTMITFSCIAINTVSAKEAYCTNKNGVSFSEEEYSFLSKMFWKGSQDLMTKEDYKKFINSGLLETEIEVYQTPLISPMSSSIGDRGKTLTVSKSCPDECIIAASVNWTLVPTIRSYDVIGAYLENTELLNFPVTTTVSTAQTGSSAEINQASNGFGVSIKLPSSGTGVMVNQVYEVKASGTIYVSYQHAMSVISLANSKKYTFSRSGYGGVFNFTGVAANTYDRMSGLKITLG